VLNELAYTNEYFCSFENENRIPNHRFDNIYEQIKRLAIENSFLEPDKFLKIAATSNTVGVHKKFFKKYWHTRKDKSKF